MIEHVLGETVAEAEAAEGLDDFRMDWSGTGSEHRLFTVADDGLVHFLTHFGDDFFDARRMDAPIKDEALHGFAGDLAPHRVEAGEDDGVGRVIDKDRDTRGRFEGADVAAFAADDAALQILAG